MPFDRERLNRLLESIKGEFEPETWQAFRRVTLDGVPADQAAAELGMTVHAVYIAKSRVFQRLRQVIGDEFD